MKEDIENDQKKYLASESDLPKVKTQSTALSYRERHGVALRPDHKDETVWDGLADKATKVYDDCMGEDEDARTRLKAADTVMEIKGLKGNKRDTGASGMTMVFSDEAVKSLTAGLSGLFQKDVTNYEDFKLSTGSEPK